MAEGAQFILGGSPTARIQAEQADLLAETPANRLAQALDAILAPIEAGRRGVRALESRMVTGGGERTVDELAPWLTATGPEAGALAASTIDQWWDREALRRALLRAATTASAVPAGLAAEPTHTGMCGHVECTHSWCSHSRRRSIRQRYNWPPTVHKKESRR